MPKQFLVVNLREYLNKKDSVSVMEDELYELLLSFSCPLNPDVEHFLKHNAIEFTKKNQSVTYLVFSQNEQDGADFVSYFSLTINLFIFQQLVNLWQES
ncbi:MAG: hypothetical protein IJ859_03110 [Synergistaceae bacterium]|nr:hypothetical protein [Synergistaceae bacterium]